MARDPTTIQEGLRSHTHIGHWRQSVFLSLESSMTLGTEQESWWDPQSPTAFLCHPRLSPISALVFGWVVTACSAHLSASSTESPVLPQPACLLFLDVSQHCYVGHHFILIATLCKYHPTLLRDCTLSKVRAVACVWFRTMHLGKSGISSPSPKKGRAVSLLFGNLCVEICWHSPNLMALGDPTSFPQSPE